MFWLFERSRPLFGIAGVLCVAFSFGVARFSWHVAAKEEATILAYAAVHDVVIRGIVIDEPDIREKNTRLVVDTMAVRSGDVWHASRGRVLLFVNRYPVFEYGDEIIVRGILTKPQSFSGFDYPAYLAKDQVYALMYYPDVEFVSSGNGNVVQKTLFRIKQSLEYSIDRVVTEPHAAFLKGILLGSRAAIPAWLLEMFRVTGVMHIIALSGFNITIIADNLSRTLRRFGMSPQSTFWISCAVIILFTIMVGASPSIVRASLMGMLVLLAWKEGRQYQGANALMCAGVLMVLHNPAIVRFDVAFQLSFLATVGLLFVAPRIQRALIYVPEFFGMRSSLASTLAAQCMVLPLLVYYFGELSLISPLTNLLILSLMPLTMFFGFISAIAGMVWMPAGLAFGGIAYVLVSYHIAVVTLLSRVPFASLYVSSLF